MAATTSAWALLILAGSSNATFGLPMKYVRRWEWENTWAVWTLLALIVLPAVLAISCIPSLLTVYREAGLRVTGIVFLLGAAWGLAQVLFGKAMQAIGIGLTFSIVLGLSAAAGSVLPMMRAGVSAAGSEAMIRIFAGLVFVALGVAACAEGGRRRERALAEHASRSGSFAPGLAMALASGLLASFMNVGISFGGPLAAQASAQGASDTSCVYAVWLPLLLGGAAPNLLYCVWLLTHRNTWAHYRGAFLVMNLCLAAAMAFFWFFGTALYGVASHALGAWGLVLGWPVFMAVIVIGAGLLSVATGEWRRSGTAPVIFQAAGILLLVFAIAFFSLAQNSLKHAEVNNASTSSLTSSRPSGSVYVR